MRRLCGLCRVRGVRGMFPLRGMRKVRRLLPLSSLLLNRRFFRSPA
jgi:hypothetical protein